MGFLDKLKPQPRWKHADPAVRLEALRELDDPDRTWSFWPNRIRTRGCAAPRRPRRSTPDVLGRVAGADAGPRNAGAGARPAGRVRLPRRPVDGRRPDDVGRRARLRSGSWPTSGGCRSWPRARPPTPSAPTRSARITDERALSSIARQAKRDDTALAGAGAAVRPGRASRGRAERAITDVAVAAFERLVDAPAPTSPAPHRSKPARSRRPSPAGRAR